jgi:hypothetical protein
MISVELVFLAFLFLAIITLSRTYFILSAFSLVNVLIYPFTSESDPHLLDILSSISFATGVAIMLFGDIHKIYQTVIIALTILCLSVMEIVLQSDFYYDISVGIYENLIAAFLIAQMMGVFRGTNYLHSPRFNLWEIYRTSRFNHHQSNQVEETK